LFVGNLLFPPPSELTNNACAQVATENEKIHETSIQLLYLFQVQKKFVQAVRNSALLA
jgi:hypothetical protein